MKKLLLSAAVLATTVFLNACSKSSSPDNNAHVMYVNGCPGTTGMVVKVNSTTVSGASDLIFPKNSGYQDATASSSSASLSFTLPDGTPLNSGSVSFSANTYYSVFVGGLITGSSVVVTTDDLTVPSTGNAKIRFVNLCSDGFSVNSYIGTSKVDSNLAYQGVSAFYEVPATTATVLLQNPSTPVDEATLSGQQFVSGKIYTVMLTGSASATTGASVLTLTIINNN